MINYQEDWLMRQIEAMVSALVHILFNIDKSKANETQMLEFNSQKKIREFILAANFCEGEDWLFDNLDESNLSWLRLALFFYSEINKCSDDFLEGHNFTREEILLGLRDICKKFGYDDIVENL